LRISRKRCKFAILVLAVFFLSVWAFYPSGGPADGRVQAMSEFKAVTESAANGGYDAYLDRHSNTGRPAEVIRIEGEDYANADGDGYEIVNGYEGLEGKAVMTPDSGSIRWTAKIDSPGMYNIRIHYFPVEGKSSAIERRLAINQAVPFTGAEHLVFNRLWGNRDEEVKRDDRGNDLRPRQVEKPSWQLVPFMDSAGYYEDPYLFHFAKGAQTLTLESLREPMVIDYIEMYRDKAVKTYAEVRKDYEDKGLQPAVDQYVLIQAEDAAVKSSPTLYPLSDRSSPTVVPYSVSKLRINTIGGLNWKLPGQWIEWEVDVKEDGLYQIALKRKQDQLRGIYATRSLTIDGEYPFQETKRMTFNFNMDWQTDVLGGKEPYLFHLTRGKHKIRLTVTLGEIAPLLRTIESTVLQLNEMYRKILIITSNTPDPYRDYQLEKRFPDMIEVFKKQAGIIQRAADYL
jgi:hypothetical protein